MHASAATAGRRPKANRLRDAHRAQKRRDVLVDIHNAICRLVVWSLPSGTGALTMRRGTILADRANDTVLGWRGVDALYGRHE